ncbi:MAG: peptidylprolyl isomerase [Acidimicrobiia bacterium]|nr:peptidylprolyl isomerase [Acidimicrobiia bacterium]
MATEKRERKRANRQARLEAAIEAQQKAKRRRQVFRITLLVLLGLAFAVVYWLVAGRGSGDDEPAPTTTTAAGSTESTAAGETTTTTGLPGETLTGATPCPPVEGAPARVGTFAEAPPMCIDPAKTYTAVFDTSAGTIRATLDTGRTPQTTNNFVVLARYRYYDGTRFFRTDPSIGIIQGGGLSNTEDPGYTIPDEGGKFTYAPGDLVMARTIQPNSAGGQFFFGVDDAISGLDAQGTYVTFGQVTEGLDVLAAILATHQADPASNLGGAPSPPVTVNSVRIEES